jgi:hypothetical protein
VLKLNTFYAELLKKKVPKTERIEAYFNERPISRLIL